MKTKSKMKEEQVESELHKKLKTKGLAYLQNKQYWVRASEMPTPVGIIDVWGISNVNSLETAGIEVKVSKNDYKSRSQQYKERTAENIANYCYLLCPEGLVTENDSPNWGILWYSEFTGRLRLVRKPVRFEMTCEAKLRVMLHLFHSGINRPDNLLDTKSTQTIKEE